MCTPFRVNLLTGRYGCQTGALQNQAKIPAGERTLADAFNRAGRETCYVGKWHIGHTGNGPTPVEMRGGFKQFIGYGAYNDYLDGIVFWDEKEEKHEFKGHRSTITTDLALERLEGLKDKPFAMFVSWQSPHYPEQPAPEFAAVYEGKAMHRRPNAQDIDPYTHSWSPRTFPETDPINKQYGNDLDEYLREYYGMVTQLDHEVGRVLARLDELGLTDKTTVVFTSDHGDLQGSHGEKNKNSYYEESVRIPCIVRTPGGKAGAVSDALVDSTDFYPTLLACADVPPEPRAEGQSLLPTLRGKQQETRGFVFSEGCNTNWLMLRDGRYKFVCRRRSYEPVALFDPRDDPYEMKNLLEDGVSDANASVRDRMQAKLKEFHQGLLARK